MARIYLTASTLAIVALVFVAPAFAQFGSIFSDSPPRPPANVPSRQQDLPPADLDRAPDFRSGVEVQRPSLRGDQPPARPLPPAMSLPPSSRPGAGTVQSQELPPPPGTTAAPPRQPPIQNVPQQGAAPAAPGQAAVPNTAPGSQPVTRQPPRAPGQPADSAPSQPSDEVVVEPPPQRIANPTAVFSGLDKITGRIISFDVAINETVQFGALQVTPRVCYSRPPTETPNTDSFVEVDEVTLSGEIKRIFSGWMFAASPGLHAIEHPIYDVWLTECKGGQNPSVADAGEPEPAAKKPPRAPPPRPRR